jgi:hypothetical protein
MEGTTLVEYRKCSSHSSGTTGQPEKVRLVAA